MAEGNLRSTSEQMVFCVYGIPQDQLSSISGQSSALVKDFFKQKGVKDFTLVGDKVKVVHDRVSIATMRNKFSCFEGHELSVMPELLKDIRVQIDEEWIKVIKQYWPKFILQEIGVAVSKTSDGVFLIGSLDGIYKARQMITEKIDAEILKNISSMTPGKTNGHGLRYSESGIHAESDLTAGSSSAKDSELATKSLANCQPNGTSVKKRLKGGVGSNEENDDCSESHPCDSNDVAFEAVGLEASVAQSDEPEVDPHSRNLASRTNTNGLVEMTSAEHGVGPKDQVTSTSRHNGGMTAVDPKRYESIESGTDGRRMDVSEIFHLKDFQLQFIERFHCNLYEQLKYSVEPYHGLTKKEHTGLLDIIQKNDIGRVIKVIENVKNAERNVLPRCADKLPSTLKVIVSFPSDFSNVQIIGLPEDAERFWTLLRQENDAYKSDLSNSKKIRQASHAIQAHELQFIKTFYSDTYGSIKGCCVHEKDLNEFLYAGTFDEVDKLKKWLRDHDIDRLEPKSETMPTFVDEEICKEVLDSMKGQIKLHLSFPVRKMYKVTGVRHDIRSFTDKLRQIDEGKREMLVKPVKTTSSSRTDSDLSHLYGATSSSDRYFAFQTPLSSIQVKIAQGDLTKQKTTAIVNPCNKFLDHLGGAAKAIANAAGRELWKDCANYIKNKEMLQTSEVMHSRSGQLNPPIKHVIHASGPVAKEQPNSETCQNVLEKTFFNCFEYANNELHVDSLSVPAISSGTFGVQKDVVAQCTWNALMRFDERLSITTSTKYLKFICFINIDQESTNSLIQTFKKQWNAYLFEQKSKVEAVQSEGLKKSESPLRRSGSSCETRRRSFKDQVSASGVTMTAKTSAANAKQYQDSAESKSVRGTTSVVQPRIKGGSAVRISSAESKGCCVCSRKRNLFARSDCPHKCCVSCTNGKCLHCIGSMKTESGPPSARTQVQSPTGGMKENDILQRPVSPETVISGDVTRRSRSFKRSLSVGGFRDRATDVDDFDRRDEGSESRANVASPTAGGATGGSAVYSQWDDNQRYASLPITGTRASSYVGSRDSGSAFKTDNQRPKEDDNCCICMDKIDDPKKLDCGHIFCRDCIDQAFTHQPKCPSCSRIFGLLKGNQPDGKMTVGKERFTHLEGYRGCGTIVISYNIPDGIQTADHPNPGQKFHGTSRTAYLPGNAEGEEVCRLLRKAFDAKLVFTVGKSNTTGRDNVVIWNDIHHKTSPMGQYGYPDPTYLQRVKDELAAKGIKSDTAGAASIPVDSRGRNSSDRPTTGGATGGYGVYSQLDDLRRFASLPITGTHAPLSLLTTAGTRSSLSYPQSDVAAVHTASSRSSRAISPPYSSSSSSVLLGIHVPSSSSGARFTTRSYEPLRTSSYSSTTSSLSSSSPTHGTGRYNHHSSSGSSSSANTYQPYNYTR